MTDQECYNIAEVLTYNKDYLKDSIKLRYIKAKSMSRDEAIYYIEDGLKYKLVEETNFSLHDLDEAFQDERVKIVIESYYTKEFYHEH